MGVAVEKGHLTACCPSKELTEFQMKKRLWLYAHLGEGHHGRTSHLALLQNLIKAANYPKVS